MFRITTKLASRSPGIYRYPHHVHYPCRLISTTPKKPITNLKHYLTAYSKVSMRETEEKLDMIFSKFEPFCTPVDQMLAQAKPTIKGLSTHQVRKAKEMVYQNIVQYLTGEGYPTEELEDYNEANLNDLVLLIILPILTELKGETGCSLLLRREQEIPPTDSEPGSFQQFVRMDFIGVRDKRFVLVVEAKKSTVGQAKWQCMLVLKDVWDNNGGGIVYGFVTCGTEWQMIQYDGMGFTQTDNLWVLFTNMRQERERWMKECSVIVDCIYMALRSGVFMAA
ncbi:hypothetical protein HOY82DRAFT_544544 [Tuber indicum]|nr:hypothetical protein HOY82DRAFT_544544 [Tuber indicum]